MLRTAQLLPQRALDTGLRPGPFPTRAASLLPGLLTATRTGLTPASDDEHEQRKHPAKSRGHLLFHWAHEWSNYFAHLDRAIWRYPRLVTTLRRAHTAAGDRPGSRCEPNNSTRVSHLPRSTTALLNLVQPQDRVGEFTAGVPSVVLGQTLAVVGPEIPDHPGPVGDTGGDPGDHDRCDVVRVDRVGTRGGAERRLVVDGELVRGRTEQPGQNRALRCRAGLRDELRVVAAVTGDEPRGDAGGAQLLDERCGFGPETGVVDRVRVHALDRPDRGGEVPGAGLDRGCAGAVGGRAECLGHAAGQPGDVPGVVVHDADLLVPLLAGQPVGGGDGLQLAVTQAAEEVRPAVAGQRGACR